MGILYIIISYVAPHGGAWIEIYPLSYKLVIVVSLPTGERGLKFINARVSPMRMPVAPHGGAWIEIVYFISTSSGVLVAPHGGAWIEIRLMK